MYFASLFCDPLIFRRPSFFLTPFCPANGVMARPARGQIFRRRKKKSIRPLGVDGTRREERCLLEVRLDRVPLHFEQHTDAVRGRPVVLARVRASECERCG